MIFNKCINKETKEIFNCYYVNNENVNDFIEIFTEYIGCSGYSIIDYYFDTTTVFIKIDGQLFDEIEIYIDYWYVLNETGKYNKYTKEEFERYYEEFSDEEVIFSLNKQNPIKVKSKERGEFFSCEIICPKCNEIIGLMPCYPPNTNVLSNRVKFCNICGQKLEWQK